MSPGNVRESESSYSYDLFISYASEDVEFVQKLVQRLERDGYNVWFDRNSMRGTGTVPDNLKASLYSCRQMLVCLSDAYPKKGFTQFELQLNFERDPGNLGNRTLVIVITSPPPQVIPSAIIAIPRIDLSNSTTYDQEYRKLKNSILARSIKKIKLPTPSEIRALRKHHDPVRILVEIRRQAKELISYIHAETFNQPMPPEWMDAATQLAYSNRLSQEVRVHINAIIIYAPLIDAQALEKNAIEPALLALTQLSEWANKTYKIEPISSDPFEDFWSEAAEKLPYSQLPLEMDLQKRIITPSGRIYAAVSQDKQIAWDVLIIPLFCTNYKHLLTEIDRHKALGGNAPLLIDYHPSFELSELLTWQLIFCNRREGVRLRALVEQFQPLPEKLAGALARRVLCAFNVMAEKSPVLCLSIFRLENILLDRSGIVRLAQNWDHIETAPAQTASMPQLENYWFCRTPLASTAELVEKSRTELANSLLSSYGCLVPDDLFNIPDSTDDDGILHATVDCYFKKECLPQWLTQPPCPDNVIDGPDLTTVMSSDNDQGLESTATPDETPDQSVEMSSPAGEEHSTPEQIKTEKEPIPLMTELAIDVRSAWPLGASHILVWGTDDLLAIYSLVDGEMTWQDANPFHLRVADNNARSGIALGSWEGKVKWFKNGQPAGETNFGAPIGDLCSYGTGWLAGAWNEKLQFIGENQPALNFGDVTGGVRRIITGKGSSVAVQSLLGSVWLYHGAKHIATNPIPNIIDFAFAEDILLLLTPAGLIQVKRNGALGKPDVPPSRIGLRILTDPDTYKALLLNEHGQSWHINAFGTFPAGPRLPGSKHIKMTACTFNKILATTDSGGYEYRINGKTVICWHEAISAVLFPDGKSIVTALPGKVVLYRDFA